MAGPRIVLPVVLAMAFTFTSAVGQARPARPPAVEGVLLDDADDTPVPDAVVRLLGPGGRTVVSTVSDPQGAFSLRAPAAGTYRLEALRIGYLPGGRDVSLEPGDTLRVVLRMETDPILLDSLVVTADRSTRPPRCAPQVVRGRVVADSAGEAGRGIAGAVMELLGAEGRPLARAGTDADGRFTLVTPGPGMFRLRGGAEGFASGLGGDLPILPGDTVEVRFRLSADAPLAGPMEITTSARPWNDRYALAGGEAFFERMADCQTTRPEGSRFADFLDRSVIADYAAEAWRVDFMIDRELRLVFSLTPGGGVVLFGGCRPALWVDGAPTFAPVPLWEFSADELEAVEIHRWPRVPRRFWIHNTSPCGVLALWTRRTRSSTPGPRIHRAWVLLGVGAVFGLLKLLL